MTFTTDSDCEVLLHLYKEYGPHFLKKVIIMGLLMLLKVDQPIITLILIINIPTSTRSMGPTFKEGDDCLQ